MINELSYSVTFPSNGQTLAGSFALQKGTTAVIGPNWSGKTFGSIEIIRYMLFGKKALRGPAPDYKALAATMICTINGEQYKIERSSKKETLTRIADEEILAVNTEAVNQKIIELLGFGLEIFDFVCAAPQGQVQKFSEQTPANRKKLLDELLKLTPQEKVEKACKEEAKTHRATASALASTLRLPVEPVRPDGYVSSADLETRIFAAKALKAERAALTMEPTQWPVPPADARPSQEKLEALREEVKRQVELSLQRSRLQRTIGDAPTAAYTAAELDAAEAWLDYTDELEARGPKPSLTLDEIEAMEKAWAMQEFGETEVECPNCHHEFAPGTVAKTPDLSKAELRKERSALANWSEPMVAVEQPSIVLTRGGIKLGRKALDNAERLKVLEAELTALPEVDESVSEQLNALSEIAADWNSYDRHMLLANERERKRADAEAALAKLPPETEDIEALQRQLVEARVYETELANYEANRKVYDETSEKMRTAEQLAVDFTEGAKAIATARLTVKAYLAPALSRVASSLIETMTAGEFTSLTVDEDMEITVGTQDINTLSGAGKTIANLALRIALGQVLTARVFPVFIGDEIDSDMDAANAAATADALASLKEHLQQIILVTHKQVEHADQLIIHPVSG